MLATNLQVKSRKLITSRGLRSFMNYLYLFLCSQPRGNCLYSFINEINWIRDWGLQNWTYTIDAPPTNRIKTFWRFWLINIALFRRTQFIVNDDHQTVLNIDAHKIFIFSVPFRCRKKERFWQNAHNVDTQINWISLIFFLCFNGRSNINQKLSIEL